MTRSRLRQKDIVLAGEQIGSGTVAPARLGSHTHTPSELGRYLSRVHLAVASIPSWANWAKIPFDTQSVQEGAADIWSAVNTRWTPVVAGYYAMTVRIRTATAGPTVAGLGKNGAVVQAIGADAGGVGTASHGSAIVYCNGTTDYVEPWAFLTTGRLVTGDAVGVDNWAILIGPI